MILAIKMLFNVKKKFTCVLQILCKSIMFFFLFCTFNVHISVLCDLYISLGFF